MEKVDTLIPSIRRHNDSGELIQVEPVRGECPPECIFMQITGTIEKGLIHECALAKSLLHGLDEITSNHDLAMQMQRWPGPTTFDCPAGVGFDGTKLHLDSVMYGEE